ncbi:MAG: hypothetical protein ACRDAL_02275 [Plesiomonas shigelloides]
MPKPSTPAVWASSKIFSFTPNAQQIAQGFDYIATIGRPEGAPITDDHDWPLNQVTAALKWIMDQLPDGGLKYGCPLVGSLIHWPLQKMPQEIWPDCGMVFIPYIGQAFDGVRYPLLKQMHPSGILPVDMRGEFARGWDNGRGVDSGRAILSTQSSSNLSHAHVDKYAFARGAAGNPGGTNSQISAYSKTFWDPVSDASSGLLKQSADGSWSGPSTGLDSHMSGGNESRPRNIAWNMIVRAA